MGKASRSPLDVRRQRKGPFALFLAASLLGGCTFIGDYGRGDFGRVKPELRFDDMHNWVGWDAANSSGMPPSVYPLTDDERLLRDLAFPLIQPPFDRQRWYSLLMEYGVLHTPPEFPQFDGVQYWVRLEAYWRRSEASAYAQIATDARNDVVGIGPFFAAGTRVADMDHKRAKSLAFVSNLSMAERDQALFRNNENAAVIAWVCRSLHDRAGAYRYALERLVIAAPSSAALDSERAVVLLEARINDACRPYGARYIVSKG
jgi:hypothetical protein